MRKLPGEKLRDERTMFGLEKLRDERITFGLENVLVEPIIFDDRARN
jgi:hypothetical protein